MCNTVECNCMFGKQSQYPITTANVCMCMTYDSRRMLGGF